MSENTLGCISGGSSTTIFTTPSIKLDTLFEGNRFVEYDLKVLDLKEETDENLNVIKKDNRIIFARTGAVEVTNKQFENLKNFLLLKHAKELGEIENIEDYVVIVNTFRSYNIE